MTEGVDDRARLSTRLREYVDRAWMIPSPLVLQAADALDEVRAERDAARAAAEEQAALVARLREALEVLTCPNCDDRLCMGCVLREYDHTCADDCPHCCVAAEGDSYWQRRVDAHQTRRAALGGGSLAATPNEDAP